MSAAPRVSVVLPFLDPEPRFLDEAIESVVAQSFDAWEFLLVDDGSGAAAREAAEGWAAAHPERIRLLPPPPDGPDGCSAARNRGLARARGELVACLDADDVWLPRRLEAHVDVLSRRPEVGMVFGSSLYWHSWTGEADDAGRDYVPAPGVPPRARMAPPGPLAAFLTGDAAVPCPCAVTTRSAVLRGAGGWDASFTGLYEDQLAWARLLLRTGAWFHDEVLDRYRQHPGSMTATSASEAERSARRRFLVEVERDAARLGLLEGDLARAIRRELRALDHPFQARLLRTARRLRRRVLGPRTARSTPRPGGEP